MIVLNNKPEYLKEHYVGLLISNCLNKENRLEGDINFSFMSDDDLLKVNNQLLNHDFYTDIITVDNSFGSFVSADVFISTDRVEDNAIKNGSDVIYEMCRVLVHGILHCCGYNDKSEDEKKSMRQAEEENINFIKFHVEHDV